MNAEVAIYQFDDVEVRPGSAEVLRNGKAVDLEPKAFRLLLHLIENRDRAVGKGELIGAVWEGAAVTDNAVTRVVAQIRRELGDDARQPRYIQTLPTLGYRFVADLKSGRPAPVSRRPKALYLAAVVAVLGAMAMWVATRAVVPPPVRSRPVQLTTSPGLDVCGSFSPDGKAIVYSSNRSGQFEIYTRSLDSAAREFQVTSDSRQNIDAVWSPDGKWIAYHSAAEHGIWIVPASGGTPRRVTDFGSAPAWSPDGRLLAFHSPEPLSFAPFDLVSLGDTIWTVAPDGSGLRRLTSPNNPPGRHAMPQWSPDGRSLVFASVWPDNALWLIEVASGRLTRLAAGHPGIKINPVFARDGRGVYFVGRLRDSSGLYYVRTGGKSAPVELYSARQNVPMRIALSPDGGQLAYLQGSVVSQLWMSPGGGERGRALFNDAVVRVKLPAWSPDGSRLAFILLRSGSNQDLWTMDAVGTGAAALAAGPGTEDAPQWLGDGSVAYTYSYEGRAQIRRIPASGGESELLRDDAAELVRPRLTPDGRDVLYETGQPGNIWIRPVRGGSPKQLTFDPEGTGYPVLSPDGQWIAYEIFRGNTTHIAVLARDGGGAPRVLTGGSGRHWPSSWSSDNRRVAYSAFRDGVWRVWWVDRVTGERRQVTHETAFGSFVRSPAWRPNSEEMVYEWSNVKGNVYLLDLNNTSEQTK